MKWRWFSLTLRADHPDSGLAPRHEGSGEADQARARAPVSAVAGRALDIATWAGREGKGREGKEGADFPAHPPPSSCKLSSSAQLAPR